MVPLAEFTTGISVSAIVARGRCDGFSGPSFQNGCPLARHVNIKPPRNTIFRVPDGCVAAGRDNASRVPSSLWNVIKRAVGGNHCMKLREPENAGRMN